MTSPTAGPDSLGRYMDLPVPETLGELLVRWRSGDPFPLPNWGLRSNPEYARLMGLMFVQVGYRIGLERYAAFMRADQIKQGAPETYNPIAIVTSRTP